MRYRREIDGLRAVAVVSVILFHAGFQTLSGGFVGVDVFFVISGYLITTILLAELQAGTFTLKGFYDRRARRILPALFVVLFACVPFAWWLLMPSDLMNFSESLIAVSSFMSNVFFWQTSGYFVKSLEIKPLLHTWSLAVEEQYYLLFPPFLILAWRFGKRWTLPILLAIAVLSLAVAQWAQAIKPAAAFYLLPSRCWELLIGCFVAFYFTQNSNPMHQKRVSQSASLLGFGMLAYAIFFFDKYTPFPSVYTLIPTVGTALILVFATQETIVGKFLASRVLVGIGLISYSAYLWHQPLFAFTKHRLWYEPPKGVFAGLAVLALVLAYLSWKYIETPFRDRSRFTRRQVFAFGALGSLFFVLIGIAGLMGKGFPSRIPLIVMNVLATRDDHFAMRDEGACNVWDYDDDRLRGCVKGDLAQVPRYAVLGDSHAASLVHELGIAFKQSGKSFVQYTKALCPLAFGLTSDQDNHCQQYLDAALEDIDRRGIDTIILANRWPIYPVGGDFDNGEGGIEKTGNVFAIKGKSVLTDPVGIRRASVLQAFGESIRNLLARGKRLIVVYSIPEQGWDIPKVQFKILNFKDQVDHKISVKFSNYQRRVAESHGVLDAIGDTSGIARVRPEAILCDTFIAGRCASHLDDAPLYFDDNHLTNAGARLLVPAIMKQIDER